MILREALKQEIGTLNESQLSRIAEFVISIKSHTRNLMKTTPFWQRAASTERAQDFREWVVGLPKTELSLSDDAFDREGIYE